MSHFVRILPSRWASRRRLVCASLALIGVLALLAITVTFCVGRKPVEAVADAQLGDFAETSADESGDKLTAEPDRSESVEPAGEIAAEMSAEMPAEKPVESPGKESVEEPADKPNDHPDDEPRETPADHPVDKPAEEAGGPSRGSTDAPPTELPPETVVADPRFKPDESVEYWEQLGRGILQTGSEAEFQEYQKARSEAAAGGGRMSPTLVNEALRLLYAEQRWDDLRRFEQGLRPLAARPAFGKPKRNERPADASPPRHSPGNPKLFDWIYEQTMEQPGRHPDFSQPLIVPVSKAASISFQDLRSALQDKQYKEAAAALSNSYALRDESLIAAPADAQLLVSYRGMYRMLLSQHELAEAMSGRFVPAAELAVQQTLAQGDPAAVEGLTVQYYGTPAHATACQWLGDRALAAADFTQALAWYEEGYMTASLEQQPDLAARVRLASAMLGNPQGKPPSQPVSFGNGSCTPEQFEHRVRDAVTQQAKVETAPPVGVFPILPVAQPVQFRFAPWDERDENGYRNLLSERFAATAEDDLLIVSDRRRAAVIESAGGKVRWRSELGKSGSPNPICPLVQGERVYLRTTMASRKYGVVCLDRKTGRVQWRRDCGDAVAGDPQLIQGRLVFLTFGAPSDIRGQATSVNDDVKARRSDCYSPVCMVQLNPENGEVLFRRHVAEAAILRSEWAIDRIPEYQSLCVGNRLVVLFYGAVLCLDPQARVEWLRNSGVIPSEIDPPSPFQFCQPPRESGGRLYLQQPGSCAVECLVAQTGELAWRRGIIGLQRILDINDDRLLVQSAYGLTTLDAATGKILWRRELPGLLSVVARNTAGQILCTRKTMQGNKTQLAMLWIDAATGETKAHSLPLSAGQDASALETVVVRGDRMWCLGYGGMEAGAKPGANGLRISTMQDAGPAKEGETP